ncbi:MAG TPA: Asp23/Gls24 family envelope stress response protein [Gaiellaceae bacterium]|nr:Asp23/Gls24 family envelope stress response protein [Gaiellaceae bacterium]
MSRELSRDAGGSVSLGEGALAQIVVSAVESVPGARLRRGRRRAPVELQAGHARADLELAVAYGSVLPEVARAVQERVAEALAGMCGVEVDAVDVAVAELVR